MAGVRKWPRYVAMALTFLIAAILVSACGSSGSAKAGSGGSSAGKGSFEIADYGDANDTLEQTAVNMYNATSEGHKVKAVLQTFPGANYSQKLQTVIGTSEAPSVFFNWGAGSIQSYVKAGLVQPLNADIQANPKLKSSFLPVVMNAGKIGGNYYGIPMRGTQPVFLFYNRTVLAKYHLTPPKTWSQLLSEVSTLKSKGLIPIALGGGDQWPELMWIEYVYDRVAGSQLITRALAGDHGVWRSAASHKALSDLTQLIKSGAFGHSYDSVKFTTGASTKLLVTGRSAFELMGSWEYSTAQGISPSFAKHDLGYASFPAIPGGAGNSSDLAGNVQNYYSVHKGAAHQSAIADFLSEMYEPKFLKALVSKGWLPTTTDATHYIKSSPSPGYLTWQFDRVKQAAHFQESWDQAWPPAQITPIHDAVGNFFDNQNASSFISAMSALPAG
jgi:xylobiose transport system substrate-binding protein